MLISSNSSLPRIRLFSLLGVVTSAPDIPTVHLSILYLINIALIIGTIQRRHTELFKARVTLDLNRSGE